jgi:hypothetical protein
MTIDDEPFNALGMIFSQMIIAEAQAVPAPATLALVLIGFAGWFARYRIAARA